MNSDCVRWISIADREAAGEPVSDEDATFLREHPSACAACASEAASWHELEKRPIDLPVESVDVEAVLRTLSRRPARVARWPANRGVLGLAAALAIAAAVALIWRGAGRNGPVARDQATPVRVVVASGALHSPGGAALAPGADIVAGAELEAREGTSCLQIDPGVRACFVAGSRARIVGTRLSDRRIELLAGRVVASLEPQPSGSGFTIATRAGTVSAVGTEFEVEIGDGVKIVVLKGVVLVRANDGTEEHLAAPRTMLLGPSDVASQHGHEPTDEAPSAAPGPASSRSGRAAASTTDKLTEPAAPGDLLQQARDERDRGRFAKAADLYRRLQAVSPDSAEARVALVSLGDLQLSHLADPAGALRSFDAYLRVGGGLAQEAWYGKIRALRTLGRAADERTAIEQFLVAYPAAVQANGLRARLSELR